MLLLTACAPVPPERSALPDVAQVLPEPTGCLFSVGQALGVGILEVIDGSSAEGVLQADDLIVAIDGNPTPDAATLSSLMRERSPGDVIELTVDRAGQPVSRGITLGANPDDPARARIGITIRTRYDTVRLEKAEDEVATSRTSRPLEIGGRIVAFDPLTTTWGASEIEVPSETNWVGTSEGLYAISDEVDAVITDLRTGDVVEHDGFREWSPRRLIGSLGTGLLIVVTADIPDQPGFVNVGIALFEPGDGVTRWVSPVLIDFGLPVAAHSAPDGSAFVAIGSDQESGAIMAVQYYNADGIIETVGDLTSLGTPIGWFDQSSVAFRSTDQSVSVFSVTDGSTQTFTLPDSLANSLITTVGDGRQILALAGRDMMLHDLTEGGEVRTLAENCAIGRIGEPGSRL